MFDFSALEAGEPAPVVDPGDLRGVWDLMREIGADLAANREPGVATPSSTVGIDVSVLARACGPGANVFAVWARCRLLEMLAHQGLLTPWQRGAQLDDAVFAAAADYPIPGLDRLDPGLFLERLGNRPSQPDNRVPG